jgi:hypothetical protein
MKEERLKILDMLEKGCINADEANRLLYAITASDDDDKLAAFARSVAHFAKEVGEKTKDMCVAVSPKIKEASKAVVVKTAEVVDGLAKSLNEAVKKMECDDCPDEEGECCCEEEENKEN